MKNMLKKEKKDIYTDLAVDLFNKSSEKNSDISVIEIDIDNKLSRSLKKKIGKYITINFNDIEDYSSRNKLINTLISCYKKIIKVKKDELVLLIGLGNPKSSCDSLGTLVSKKIMVTNIISDKKDIQKVSSINTNVMGETGIESSDIVKGIVKQIKPKLIIVVDSLATTSLERLNKSIQITNTGIYPGSGVGNKRKEISFKTLKIPVICIGVPTVIKLSNVNSDIEKEYLDLIVTPSEIEQFMDNISNVISESLDLYFHNI